MPQGDNASGLLYEGGMRAIAIAATIALLQATPAFAQSKPAAKPKADPLPKANPAKTSKTCEEFGAGFTQIEGTKSCVQVRGYLRMQGSTR